MTMYQRNHRAERTAYRVSVIGVLSGISLALLYISSLVPTCRMGLVAAAGVVPAGAVISAGISGGFCCYAVTGILGLLLLPGKGNALLYLAFFGLYPMIKSLVERLGRRLPELILKYVFFNIVLTVLYFGLGELFLPFLPQKLSGTVPIYAVLNIVFFIYDLGFSQIISFYCVRIDKVLRKDGISGKI